MKTSIKLLSVACLAMAMQSCYEEYKFDYTHTTTYFANQKPLRTLVEDPSSDALTFSFGAVLAGKYENDQDYKVSYEIDPSLLDSGFHTSENMELLPADYYTLSDPATILVPAGDIVGEVAVTIDKEKFMSDPKGVEGKYVLPLRMVATEADSINGEKYYTMIAVQYVSEHAGHYYVKGKDVRNTDGNEVEYNSDDLVSNRLVELTNISKDQVNVPYVGRYNTADDFMTLNIDGTTVTFPDNYSTTVTNVSGSGSYTYTDKNTKNMTLNYSYTDADGAAHTVTEELIFTKLVLTFEEWN